MKIPCYQQLNQHNTKKQSGQLVKIGCMSYLVGSVENWKNYVCDNYKN